MYEMQDITDSHLNLNVIVMSISVLLTFSLLYNYRTNFFLQWLQKYKTCHDERILLISGVRLLCSCTFYPNDIVLN